MTCLQIKAKYDQASCALHALEPDDVKLERYLRDIIAKFFCKSRLLPVIWLLFNRFSLSGADRAKMREN